MSSPDVCPALSEELWGRHLADDERELASIHFSQELEHKLLRRLAEAWNDLNYQYLARRLKAPSIRLSEGETRWGSWDASRRLITIARRQVLAYTWESALETLKHEMAHQFVSEVMGDPPERPHGVAFRAACKLLCVSPDACSDGGVSLFRAGGPGAEANEPDVRLLRVQKLLALAENNPNEHEARVAFARASELMLKFNLDGLAVREAQDDYSYRFLGKSSGRTPHHHYAIAGILQEFFFVQCIWVDSYNALTGVRGHRLEIMGSEANVAMADYVYACLLRQSEALWRDYKAKTQSRDRRAKRQYLDGVLTGFRKQLEQTSERNTERGLIWLGDPGLKSFYRRRHPRVTTTRLQAVGPSEARAAGVQAGKKLRLHKPVGAGRSRGRLLSGG